jgi:hypothetical protein
MTGTVTNKLVEYINKCYILAEEMFGKDGVRDAVDLRVTDLSQYEVSHYNEIPHFYVCRTTEEKEARLQLLLQNVRIASEKLHKEIEIKNIAFRYPLSGEV